MGGAGSGRSHRGDKLVEHGGCGDPGTLIFCWHLFKISHNRNFFQLSELWKEKDFQGFKIIKEVIKTCITKI